MIRYDTTKFDVMHVDFRVCSAKNPWHDNVIREDTPNGNQKV